MEAMLLHPAASYGPEAESCEPEAVDFIIAPEHLQRQNDDERPVRGPE